MEYLDNDGESMILCFACGDKADDRGFEYASSYGDGPCEHCGKPLDNKIEHRRN